MSDTPSREQCLLCGKAISHLIQECAVCGTCWSRELQKEIARRQAEQANA
jgi:hypothetical protein